VVCSNLQSSRCYFFGKKIKYQGAIKKQVIKVWVNYHVSNRLEKIGVAPRVITILRRKSRRKRSRQAQGRRFRLKVVC